MKMLSMLLFQLENVQAAAEKFDALLTVMFSMPAAPFTASELEINPVPTWAALRVRLDVPDVLLNARDS